MIFSNDYSKFDIDRLNLTEYAPAVSVVHSYLNLPKNLIAVYVLWHLATSSFYIGSAINLDRRLKEHRWLLGMGKHQNKRIQRCYDKYGVAVQFSYFIVSNREEAFRLEQELLDLNKQDEKLLNLTYNVYKCNLGKPHTEETKAKIGAANKGRKHTAETKAKVSAANTGRVFTDEQKQRMSLSKMGIVQSEETKQKRREMMMGNKIGLGRKHTDEVKERIRLSNLNKIVSLETRMKISEARRLKPRIDPRSVPVIIDGIDYTSANAAAKILGLRPSVADYRVKSKSFPTWTFK